MGFRLYIVHVVNYSEKSFIVSFGFTNKHGQIKSSEALFVPKSQVVKLDLEKKIIELTGWYYSKYGYLWRYRVDKLKKGCKPVKILDCLWDTFDPNHPNYTPIPDGILS